MQLMPMDVKGKNAFKYVTSATNAVLLNVKKDMFINLPELNKYELISYVARPESRNILDVQIF